MVTGKTELTLAVTGSDVYIVLKCLDNDGWELGANNRLVRKKIEVPQEDNVFADPPSDFIKADPKSEPKRPNMKLHRLKRAAKAEKSKKTKKRKRWLTKSMKQKLRHLAKDGVTITEASNITGVPYHSIYLWKEVKSGSVKFAKGKGGRRKGVRN